MVKHFIRYWLPLVLFMIFIFYMSSLPLNNDMQNIEKDTKKQSDIIYHLVEFSFLGVLSRRAFKNSNSRYLSKNYLLLAITFAIVYGILDEIHQIYVPTRYFELKDLVFNTIGSSSIVLLKLLKL